MKSNLMTRLIIGGLIVGVVGGGLYYRQSEKVARENATRIVMDISGMTCGSCKSKIEANLTKLKGVYTAEVDLDSDTGAFEFNAKKVSKADIIKAIKGLGYANQIKKDSSRLQVIDYNIKFN